MAYWVTESSYDTRRGGLESENRTGPYTREEAEKQIQSIILKWRGLKEFNARVEYNYPYVRYKNTGRIFKQLTCMCDGSFSDIQDTVEKCLDKDEKYNGDSLGIYKNCVLNWETIQNLRNTVDIVLKKGKDKDGLKVCADIIESFIKKFEVADVSSYAVINSYYKRTQINNFFDEPSCCTPSQTVMLALKEMNFQAPFMVALKNPNTVDEDNPTYINLEIKKATETMSMKAPFKIRLWVSALPLEDTCYINDRTIFDWGFNNNLIEKEHQEFRKIWFNIASDDCPIKKFYNKREEEKRQIEEEKEKRKNEEITRSLDDIDSLLDSIGKKKEPSEPITFQPTGLVPVEETSVVPYEEPKEQEKEVEVDMDLDWYWDIGPIPEPEEEKGRFNIFTRIKKAFE